MQNFIIRITQENFKLIDDSRFSCFILPDTADETFASEFVQKAQKNEKLVLIEGENALELQTKYHSDGILLDASKEENPQKIIKKIQQKIPKAILGVISRNRRHEAMLISECEPDFIAFKVWKDGFKNNEELLAWYTEFFLIQCAAIVEENIDYSSLPADLIILDNTKLNGK